MDEVGMETSDVRFHRMLHGLRSNEAQPVYRSDRKTGLRSHRAASGFLLPYTMTVDKVSTKPPSRAYREKKSDI